MNTQPASDTPGLNRTEIFLLLSLAAVQFTNIMDFMIMMPLGPQLMRLFGLSPAQFGFIVSSYTFAAGTTGFLSSFYMDRFDRKRSLATIYAGFVVGTLAVALSPSYAWLVAARILTGCFGGMMMAIIFAIVGDVIPSERRGRAMGVVMTSFSAASIFGVPFGLYLASIFSWHAPFLFVVGAGVLIWLMVLRTVPSVKGHLENRTVESPLALLRVVKASPQLQIALCLTPTLMLGHFSVIPFLSPYMVANVGFTDAQLTFIYLFGGIATLFTSPWIGRQVDRKGAFRIFLVANIFAVPLILTLTHLPAVPIAIALSLTTAFFIASNGRMVPSMTLLTSAVPPKHRGGFMSLNGSLQQLSCGIAAMIAGTIVASGADGHLQNYGWVGYFAVIWAVVAVWISSRVRPFSGA